MAWEELLNEFRADQLERQIDDATPPTACPNDGEPLHESANGELRCISDGWVWDGQPVRYN